MASEIRNRFTDTEMQIAKETDLPELLSHLGYQVMTVKDAAGAELPVMVYIMAEPYCRQPALLSPYYYRVILKPTACRWSHYRLRGTGPLTRQDRQAKASA